MPGTRRSLPRYKGTKIDNTDLLEAIDHVGDKIQQTLALVDSIQNQSTKQVPTRHNRSTRPARAHRSTWSVTDLVVMATPEGRTVRFSQPPAAGPKLSEHHVLKDNNQVLPYGLQNAASRYAHQLHNFPPRRGHMVLHVRSDELPVAGETNFERWWREFRNEGRAERRIDEFKEQERFYQLQQDGVLLEDDTSSSGSTRTPTTPAGTDQEYDLDLPPPGFGPIPRFPPRRGNMMFNVSNDEPMVKGETDQQRQERE
jgi:hypothetical protein